MVKCGDGDVDDGGGGVYEDLLLTLLVELDAG